jgi:hypothetical protein
MIRLVLTVFFSATVIAVSAPSTTALPVDTAPIDTVGEGWDGPGRGRAHLKFHFGSPTRDLTLDSQRATLTAALNEWASVAAVSFKETARADLPGSIDITFRVGGFDPGVLAFAFFPDPPNPESIAGDVVFNDAFSWEIGNNRGSGAFDLMLIATHEFGHSLGVGHTSDPEAVMHPFFEPNEVFTGLHPPDVAGIQSLYAVPEPSTIFLLTSGLAGLGAVAWRRGRNG